MNSNTSAASNEERKRPVWAFNLNSFNLREYQHKERVCIEEFFRQAQHLNYFYNMRRLLTLFIIFYLLLNPFGLAAQQFRNTYGFNGDDDGVAAHQTNDGGFIVLGTTGTNWQVGNAVYLIKLDASGAIDWSRTYGDNGLDVGVEVAELLSGYVVLSNTSNGSLGGYDIQLREVNALGDEVWSKDIGGNDWDLANDLVVVSDGYLITGKEFSSNNGMESAFVLKTDLAGDTLWSWTSSASLESAANSIVHTTDGGFLAAGYERNSQNNLDGKVWKLDQIGQLQWEQTFGGTDDDHFNSCVEFTSQSEYVLAGVSKSFTGAGRIWMQALDLSGNPVWDQNYVDETGITEIIETKDNQLAISGYRDVPGAEREMIFTRYFPGGWFNQGADYGDGFPTMGLSIDTLSTNGFVLVGWAQDLGPGPRAIYVVTTDSVGNTSAATVSQVEDPALSVTSPEEGSIVGLPNLIVRGTDIILQDENSNEWEWNIYTTHGALIDAGKGQRIPTSGLVSGFHLLHIKLGSTVIHQKIMVLD